MSGDEPFGFTVPLRWDPFSPRERGRKLRRVEGGFPRVSGDEPR